MNKSILQDWVNELGLRHQGVLLGAIRGCDTAPKNDPSKLFTRCLRSLVLNPHCGDATKAATYIEVVAPDIIDERFTAFRKNLDHYPYHYVNHVMHAIEVIGYKHPDPAVLINWKGFYFAMCKGLHINPETEEQLDERLNRDEESFARANEL